MTSDIVDGRAAARGFIGKNATLIAGGVLAVVLIGFFALASLADRSGPGDALYGFELSVAEPVAGAFRFTSNARANYHYERLLERLTESRDVPFEIEGDERAALLAPVADNILHQVRSILGTFEGRSDERAIEIAVNTVAILELYETTYSLQAGDSVGTVGEAVDDARARLNEMLAAYRDRFTLPELEEMLVREITIITDEAQTATPYTLNRVTENLYDILDMLGEGNVLGAYDIVFQIKIDLAKDRFSQTLLG